MKKIFLLFILSVSCLALIPGLATAQVCDQSNGGVNGIVPCGRATPTNGAISASNCFCTLEHIPLLIRNVFNFLVTISTALAGLGIVIGGVFLIVSAGSPGLAGRGRHIIKWSILSILLIYGSWLIVTGVMVALGVSVNTSSYSSTGRAGPS